MRISSLKALAVAGAVALGLAAPREAEAALTFTFLEQGGNVIGSGSGSFNLAGLRLVQSETNTRVTSQIRPLGAVLSIGSPDPVSLDLYVGFTSTPVFGVGYGSGSFTNASAATGGPLIFAVGSFAVPGGYASGAPLSGSITFTGASFASLGMTPGTYVWTWGSGETADSFTLQVGRAPTQEPGVVPAPASALLLGAGLLGLAVTRRRARVG
jgi:hypothetical protein